MARHGRAVWVCLGFVGATAGCPGTLEDPGRFLLASADDTEDGGSPGVASAANGGDCQNIPDLFATTCTSSTCHSASNKAQGLDLQSPDVASRLVGVSATEGPGLLIDPSAPSQSILYLKLMPNPPFGARMPLGETPLSANMTACVFEWINQEASPMEAGAEGGGNMDGGEDGETAGDGATE